MVTNTINEKIAHDCVQELLKKLSDERKLSSDKNVRIAELEGLLAEATMNMLERRSLDHGIFKLAEDHKRAMAFIAEHLETEAKESEDDE